MVNNNDNTKLEELFKMTMKQTMETLMGLKNQGVDIYLTDAGWALLVRITAELDKSEEVTEEQVG